MLKWGSAIFFLLIPVLSRAELVQSCQYVEEPIFFQTIPNCTYRLQGTAIQYNSLGIRDEEPAPKEPGELRIMLFGGFFTTMDSEEVPLDASVAKRLGDYLSLYLSRKVTVINASIPRFSILSAMGSAEALIQEYKPDYVYFSADGPHTVMHMAAVSTYLEWTGSGEALPRKFGPLRVLTPLVRALAYFWPDELRLDFTRVMLFQLGLIEFSRDIQGNKDRATALLQPFIRLVKNIQRKSEANGAKFSLIWPGQNIILPTWNFDLVPAGWTWPVRALNPMKERFPVGRLDMIERLTEAGIPLVASFQMNNVSRPNVRGRMAKITAADQFADRLATVLMAKDF